MQVFADHQLAAWAAAVPDIDKTIAPITDSLKEAVEILQEEFGPTKLTLQGSYARSTAVPASDVDYLLYCSDTPRVRRDGLGRSYATALREVP